MELRGPDNEHLYEMKIRCWKGPDYIQGAAQWAGVDWIRAREWWPYQRPTFVHPVCRLRRRALDVQPSSCRS